MTAARSRMTRLTPAQASLDGERASSPRASARRQASARPATRRTPAPRAPRRVSGPARTPAPQRQAALAGGAVARPVALPRPVIGGGLGERLGAWVRNLPDHRLLDRLIRGRAWIIVLGVLLAGIVALQVSMLKLNTGISRAVEHEQTLQRENQALQASLGALGSDARLQALAERQGFVTPTAGSERNLTVGARDAQRAARAIRPPQPHSAATTTASTTTTTAAATTTAPPATTSSSTTAASTTTPAATPTPAATTTTPNTSTTAQQIAPPPTGTTGGTGTTGATGVTSTTGAATGGAAGG
jgi:hypothetical protein